MDQYSPGLHLLIDCWGANHLTDIDAIEQALRCAVKDSGATLLHLQLHSFGESCGVTGVALLAESHISIHTWPERNFMALDVFLCGSRNAYAVVESIKKSFQPNEVKVTEVKRG